MDDEWDAGDIEAKFELAMRSNKWEGEDEEEEVKDSWEEVDEEKKDPKKPVEAPKVQAPKAKPKKSLTEKIEERERKAKEDAERKAKEKEEALTPEERRAEVLRRQRLQEEADLRIAMETFGVQESGLDAMMPETKEEFDQFCEILAQKINSFNKHTEFTAFAEELINRIAVNLSSTSLKKLKTTIENLAIEKSKLEKGDKGKKKGKGKAKLKIEGDNVHLTEYDTYTYDNEYDDFM